MYKSKKGITLIALVVTIIVLLILAGISISMLSGQNGILTRAGDAKTNTEKAIEKEQINIAIANAISNSKNATLEIDNLKESITINTDGIPESKTSFPLIVAFNKTGNKYIIDSNGKVIELELKAIISDEKIVLNSNGIGTEVVNLSQNENTKLYISFKITVDDGEITDVICNNGTPILKENLWVTEISKGGKYLFTIKTKRGNQIGESMHEVNVKAYKSKINVGDYVQYIPVTDDIVYYAQDTEVDGITKEGKLTSLYTGSTSNLTNILQNEVTTWKVLKIEDEGIKLIGNCTDTPLYLFDARGYNNGVNVLNNICRVLWSNNRLGIIARSVNREDDFEDEEYEIASTETRATWQIGKKNYINSFYNNLNGKRYIENIQKDEEDNILTITLNQNRSKYPKLYEQEIGSQINANTPNLEGLRGNEEGVLDISNEEQTRNANNSDNTIKTLTITPTHYELALNYNNSFGDAGAVLTTENSNETYWVASRSINCDNGYGDSNPNAIFGLVCANTQIESMALYFSKR